MGLGVRRGRGALCIVLGGQAWERAARSQVSLGDTAVPKQHVKDIRGSKARMGNLGTAVHERPRGGLHGLSPGEGGPLTPGPLHAVGDVCQVWRASRHFIEISFLQGMAFIWKVIIQFKQGHMDGT